MPSANPVPNPNPSTASAGAAGTRRNDAVWMLVLPHVRRLLCHARQPPALVHELLRRGTRVDVVSRCDLESWRLAAPDAMSSRLRCVWEPDPEVDYDLALLWDPRSAADVSAWLAAVTKLALVPREVAVWSRNPWRPGPAPHWFGIDQRLRRAGWQPRARFLAVPEPERVRQIVAWNDWSRTPLVQHRRTYRPWKDWLVHRNAYRWLLPARLQRAPLAGTTPAPAVLDTLLAAVAADWDGSARLERLLVSPNGVAIAALRLHGGCGDQNAILKSPYAAAAEGRVARNAAALEWMEAHAERLGVWGRVAPRLLGHGWAGTWSWTLEERVDGSDAQSWPEPAAERAMHHLAAFQAALAHSGEALRPLDAETLDRRCGAPVRVAAALLEPRLARRLHALGEQLIQTLRELRLPLVPRHGDFKLENVLGDAARPEELRILDWELFTPRGLPLLDLWHLIASRRARRAGCSMGTAVQRWLLPGALTDMEKHMVQQLSHGLDARYVELSPILYWLDRIGPVAARGAWPAGGWEISNVVPVLEGIQPVVEVGR